LEGSHPATSDRRQAQPRGGRAKKTRRRTEPLESRPKIDTRISGVPPKAPPRPAFQTVGHGESQSSAAKFLPEAEHHQLVAVVDECNTPSGDDEAPKPSRSGKNPTEGVVHSLSPTAILFGCHGNNHKRRYHRPRGNPGDRDSVGGGGEQRSNVGAAENPHPHAVPRSRWNELQAQKNKRA